MIGKKIKATPSYSSPKGGSRGCLCKDGRTYSSKCCDGSLQAQGVGSVTKSTTTYYYKLQKCGHSSQKEIYIEGVELTVNNIYYFDFVNGNHNGCYTVTHTRTSGDQKVNSVVAYNDCDDCIAAN